MIKKTKISFVSSSPFIPRGGSEITTLERLSLLQKKDFTVEVISFSFLREMGKILAFFQLLEIEYVYEKNKFSYFYDDVLVKIFLLTEKHNLKAFFIEKLLESNPDLIKAFFFEPFLAEFEKNYPNKPIVYFVYYNEFAQPKDLNSYLKNHIFRQKNFIVSSNFLKKSFYQVWGKEAFIFNDYIDQKKYRAEFLTKEFITMINPERVKGIGIFLKIVREMPERKFLLVGNWKLPGDLPVVLTENFKNITYLPITGKMRDVYAKTAILLVPSIWEEAFGRIVIEAFVNGIPVLASNTGALTDTVGKGGFCFSVDNFKGEENKYEGNVDDWKELIKKLDDPFFYQKVSEQGFIEAQNYLKKSIDSLEKFIIYLSKIINYPVEFP